ncbi:hypothetical protein CLV47_105186 [Antricoccus suffuscus]|uniref:Uncharacterized protein n=1 Tax=Antricoccus suffuscus TaxID=1629062 RepID=A0A2T1A206_9ACTN|nr:hypothetical protein [Antricoccus suffuscus]PRZ42564.1 hypothetical protein CLV47_105186 [Antricoccus suffuscus]
MIQDAAGGQMVESQFKLSLPTSWIPIDALGDSVTEAVRVGDDLEKDALLRLESKSYSGHLTATNVADQFIGHAVVENPHLTITQAVDHQENGSSQAIRIAVDDSTGEEMDYAFVFIAEPCEDVRSRVVPQLTLTWSARDSDALKPELDHVIESFRFTPPTSP